MILTPEQALTKVRKYCAYQERSQEEVRTKLYSLGLHKQQVEQAIAILITENFINEERFAIAFAGGKFRIKRWGRIKIKSALQKKKISPYCINKSLLQISKSDYTRVIRKLISEQEKKISEKNKLKRNYRIAQSLISKGFEPHLVWEELGTDEYQ